MKALVKLDNKKHLNIKIPDSAKTVAMSTRHMMQVRVMEIPNIAANCPVFISRNPTDGQMLLSALSSFQPGESLLVEQEQWLATHQPLSMQTHPLYLMNNANGDGYSIGIDESADSVSSSLGTPLFTTDGEASLHLIQMQKMLEDSIRQDMQTAQFLNKLDSLGLIKPIWLILDSETQASNTIQGLMTINEEVLSQLSPEQLAELNSQGYLVPIFSLLTSLYQLNTLMNMHNKRYPGQVLSQIKLSVPK